MRSIVLLLVAVPLVAQELSRDQVAGVARAVDAQRKAQQIPAVSVAVARGGRVVHACPIGDRNNFLLYRMKATGGSQGVRQLPTNIGDFGDRQKRRHRQNAH